MTPTHDQATLFMAPTSGRDAGRTDRTLPAADHRAEAMQALCHPFAVRAEPATDSVR
ncbi:hypothetical protein OHA21_27540 [Actinoplanes sp. NBC_00393]|uniref:hypothetical protein n=1 Tax=Actinoplanes sp. NBC_00393 TaxID=2975953 RepID=UPI002E1D3A3B